MSDWLKDFLRDSEAKGFGNSPKKTPRFFSPPTPKSTEGTTKTPAVGYVVENYNPESQRKSEETTDSGSRTESVDSAPPGDSTKLTKPLSEGHQAIYDTAARSRPSDVRDAHWAAALRGLRAFLAAGYGEEAARLGWPAHELFRVPTPWVRDEWRGAGLQIGDGEVTEITASRIGYRASSGAQLAVCRTGPHDYAAGYRTRLKARGEDACREEVQLRVFEAVVGDYLANNPSVTIDQAAASVRAAINGEQ